MLTLSDQNHFSYVMITIELKFNTLTIVIYKMTQ